MEIRARCETRYKENVLDMGMILDPGMWNAPAVMRAKCALTHGATTSTLRSALQQLARRSFRRPNRGHHSHW